MSSTLPLRARTPDVDAQDAHHAADAASSLNPPASAMSGTFTPFRGWHQTPATPAELTGGSVAAGSAAKSAAAKTR